MKLLIVIDMQNDFIDGSLGTKEAVAIVPNVAKKIAKTRAAGETVVFTRDTHQSNYLKTQEGKKLPILHCVQGSDGWQISSKLKVGDSRIFDKPSFGSMELADYVATLHDLKEIELVGLCTGICVRQTVALACLCYKKNPSKKYNSVSYMIYIYDVK